MSKQKISILFTDDNIAIIESLKRMSTIFSTHWKSFFAVGANEAIELLETKSFDVIVTDLEMPEYNGVKLLKYAQNKFPDTIRVVYSGEFTKESVQKISPFAHRFIAKPCSNEKMLNTIDSTLFIHRVLDKKRIQKVLTSIGSIPSLPKIYTELINRVDDDDFSLKDAAKLISSDVGMSVNILKQINLLGVGEEIKSIEQAVTLLGLNSIKSIVLSNHVFTSFKPLYIPHFSQEQLIRHSMLTAIFAKEIAFIETGDRSIAESAFVVGVIHDFGTLIFADRFMKKYSTVMNRVHDTQRPIIDVERNVIGVSHAEVGSYLLALWGFPDAILRAVAFHESADTHAMGSEPLLTSIVAANYFAHQFDNGDTASDTALEDSHYFQNSNSLMRLPLWEERCKHIYDSMWK